MNLDFQFPLPNRDASRRVLFVFSRSYNSAGGNSVRLQWQRIVRRMFVLIRLLLEAVCFVDLLSCC